MERRRKASLCDADGVNDTSLNRQAFAAGAQMCVTKPFRREALVTAITVALQMKPE